MASTRRTSSMTHGKNARPPSVPPANVRASNSGAGGSKSGLSKRSSASSGRNLVASVIGFLVAAGAGGAVVYASGCHRADPPGNTSDEPARAPTLPAPISTARTAAVDKDAGALAANAADAGAKHVEAEKPYDGPMIGATGLTTLVYPTPEFTKKPGPIGYLRLGGKAPLDPAPPIKNDSCKAGWYHLVDGGYVCGKYATPNINDPLVKLGITAPNLDDLLPYKYAYNTLDGTPLYHQVPSKEDMYKYEPYLEAAKKAKHKSDDPIDQSAVPGNGPGDLTLLPDAGAPDDENTPPKPWWDHDKKEKSPSIKLADLESEGDSTMAKRMVKGFFVAVDKSFGWNDRLWYKTTGGLVAPADRMYLVKAPDTVGMEVPDGVKQIGFITMVKTATKWDYDAETKKLTPNGSVKRFAAFGLTGAKVDVQGRAYRQTTEGWWFKQEDGTITEPGDKPTDLAPGEKWIDVNLTRRTLVAFEGDKPWYAALVSPGKRSTDKKKDHRTITGTFRIREKHIAVTMDGDGRTASDLPYSIEDVPYVEYFEGSYALHGAFWHNNFGHDMSHGCVNLSPLDAKKLFFWTEPKLPRGWHAVWSTPEDKGTIVVVHE